MGVVLPFPVREIPATRPSTVTYHCKFSTDRPDAVLAMAELATKLGVRMLIGETPPDSDVAPEPPPALPGLGDEVRLSNP